MRARLFVVWAVLLLAMVRPGLAAGFDHSELDGFLRKYVSSSDDGHSTKVDYAGIKQSKSSLSDYLDRTAAVSQKTFDAWPKSEQLAFLINLYNARTIELVLEGYPGVASIKDLGSMLSSPWSKEFVPLLGKTRSLDDIEHQLIRGSGRYNDPRVHFAVNCASIGCPALRMEAYAADQLDAQLEDQTVKFLSDKSRNRLTNGTLEVSSIFKWYREDFAAGFRGAGNLEGFLALYSSALNLAEPDLKLLKDGQLPIRFLKYDWNLNKVR
jgi:hypothetical protein